MAILDQFGYPAYVRFLDAAQPSDKRPYQQTRTEGILRAVNTFDWRTVLYASRKLYANMGIARGAIRQKRDFSIGRAWQPIFHGADKDWGKLATQWLTEIFYPMCEVRGGAFDFVTTLGVDSVAIDRDGGYGILLTETEDGFPQTQRIPIHRFGARLSSFEEIIQDGDYKGCKIYQGIIYAKDGVRPVAYRIYTDPVNLQAPLDGEYQDISARDLIHVYEPEWYDQGHGFPAFTHAINQLRDVKQSGEWEQMAMLIASSIGLVETTETGEADPGDPRIHLGRTHEGTPECHREMAVQTMEGGTVKLFKAGTGSKIEMPSSARPGPDWESFSDRMIRDALSGIGWPYSMTWKADGGGFDKRDDISQARQTVCSRQDILRPAAKRIIGYAVSKAIKRGDLPAYQGQDPGGSLKWGFQMPAIMTIDDGRASDARREDFRMGFTNLREVYSVGGNSWIEGREQRDVEVDDLLTRAKKHSQKHGIVMDQAIMLMQQNTPNQQSAQGEPDGGAKDPPAKPIDKPDDE